MDLFDLIPIVPPSVPGERSPALSQSGGLTYVLGRLLSTPIAWAVVLAMSCAMFCLIADGCALLLYGLLRFFHDF